MIATTTDRLPLNPPESLATRPSLPYAFTSQSWNETLLDGAQLRLLPVRIAYSFPAPPAASAGYAILHLKL